MASCTIYKLKFNNKEAESELQKETYEFLKDSNLGKDKSGHDIAYGLSVDVARYFNDKTADPEDKTFITFKDKYGDKYKYHSPMEVDEDVIINNKTYHIDKFYEPTLESLLTNKDSGIYNILKEEMIIKALDKKNQMYDGTNLEDFKKADANTLDESFNKIQKFNDNNKNTNYIAVLDNISDMLGSYYMVPRIVKNTNQSNNNVAQTKLLIKQYNNFRKKLNTIFNIDDDKINDIINSFLERENTTNSLTTCFKEAANFISNINKANKTQIDLAFAPLTLINSDSVVHTIINSITGILQNNNINDLKSLLKNYFNEINDSNKGISDKAIDIYSAIMLNVLADPSILTEIPGPQNIKDLFKARLRTFKTPLKDIINKDNFAYTNFTNDDSWRESFETKDKEKQDNSDKYNALIQKQKETYDKLIKIEKKRLEIISKKDINKDRKKVQTEILNRLQNNAKLNTMVGFMEYMQDIISSIANLKSKLDDLDDDSTSSLNDKSKILLQIKEYKESYSSILNSLMELLQIEKSFKYPELNNIINVAQNYLNEITADFNIREIDYAKQFFTKYFNKLPNVKDGIYTPELGPNKGQSISLDDLLTVLDRDISAVERWLYAASESNDLMIALLDDALKDAYENYRLESIDELKTINALGLWAESVGITNFEFMHEKDKNGNLTGNYVDPQTLSGNKKIYAERFMTLKNKYDANYPKGLVQDRQTIKVLKSLLQALRDPNLDYKGKQDVIKNAIKRSFTINEMDQGTALSDFNNKRIFGLFTPYIKMNAEHTEKDVSTDDIDALRLYAAASIRFRELNKIASNIELSADYLSKRKVQKRFAGKAVLNENGENVYKAEEEINANKRIADYVEMNLYSHDMPEATLFKSNISASKMAGGVNTLSSLSTLALNILTGISNVTTGQVMMRVEALAGEFFTEPELIKSDGIYAKNIPMILSELGNKSKTNKLTLFNELFNTLDKADEDLKESNFYKNKFLKVMNLETLFFIMSAGEHYMHSRTGLSCAVHYKMKTNTGKECNLWDALEVQYLDPSNHKLGAKLVIKQGYTKLDGSEFTTEDIKALSNRIGAINHKMHGIYNKIDRSAFQKGVVGKMVILYRQWIMPAISRRFRRGKYNMRLGAYDEGYYNTTGKFIIQCMKDLKKGQFLIATNYKNLSKTERCNLKRAAAEVAQFLLILIALSVLYGGKKEPDDTEERTWSDYLLEYQLRRLYTEIGVLVPGASMANEGLRILQSPAAGCNQIQYYINLSKLCFKKYYEVEPSYTGIWDGHSQNFRNFINALPIVKPIMGDVDIKNKINFYKSQFNW